VPRVTTSPVPSVAATSVPAVTTPPVTTPPPEIDFRAWLIPSLLALVCALLISAGVIVRAMRRPGLEWLKAHVTVTPTAGPAATFETQPDDEPNRDHVITVVPVQVERSTTVDEIHS